MTAQRAGRLYATSIDQFANEEFLLSGNIVPDAWAVTDTVAAAYDVFDARLLADGSAAEAATLGRVDVLVDPDRLLIDGLTRLEIGAGRRQRGAGRRLVQSLAATAPAGRLNIYDIQPEALDFWIALGCAFRPRGDVLDGSYVLPQAQRGGSTD